MNSRCLWKGSKVA